MTTLKGKTLFITGASRGIGLAIALRAARDGANVAIAAKSDVPNPKLPGTIHTAAAEIVTAGGQALATVLESARAIPVVAKVDVVVAGGTIAGVAAAEEIARSGRSVPVVQQAR